MAHLLMRTKEKKIDVLQKNSCPSYRSNIIEDEEGSTEDTLTIVSNVKGNKTAWM
jgi:hypothetical protein